jgi:hypothetical protein
MRTNWVRVRVGRDIEATRRLLNEARDLCRQRRMNFDRWCLSGKIGIHRSQIYNLLNGRSSSHIASDSFAGSPEGSDRAAGSHLHPVGVLHGKTVDKAGIGPDGGFSRRSMDDNVSTAHEFARRIVEHFPIRGRVLDPCRGGGAFYDALPEPKFGCEIKEGRDFLDWTEHVDWIVTNPAWSTEVYRAIARHAYKIADNVVFLVRWHNATGTTARHYDWLDAGHGWRETIVVSWRDAGFLNTNGDEKHAEGFCLAVFWWQRGWTGPMTTTYWTESTE